MQKHQGVAINQYTVAMAGVTVTVTNGGGGLALIYSDNSGTPKANPFVSDAGGSYEFYAKNGRYNVTLSKAGYTFDPTDTSDLTLFDPRAAQPLNALEYGDTVEAGVTAIQAAAGAGTGESTAPVHIYIPAGTHTLTGPITITRHRVTVTIDGGATLLVAVGQQGFFVNGSANSDGNIRNLVVRCYGQIKGVADGTGELDGVALDNVIHSNLLFNEIRWLGRDGIRLTGACFSNRITYNRMTGFGGWGINMVGDAQRNAMVFDGEIQWGALGGINAYYCNGCEFRGQIENIQGSAPALKLDTATSTRIAVWFEGNGGDDIVTAASLNTVRDTVVSGSIFVDQKASPDYNINLANSTAERFTIADGRAVGSTRVLFVGTGNTAVTLGAGAQSIGAGAITNNASTETKRASLTTTL